MFFFSRLATSMRSDKQSASFFSKGTRRPALVLLSLLTAFGQQSLQVVLVAGIHSDDAIARHKGPPMMSDDERRPVARCGKPWEEPTKKSHLTCEATRNCSARGYEVGGRASRLHGPPRKRDQ